MLIVEQFAPFPQFASLVDHVGQPNPQLVQGSWPRRLMSDLHCHAAPEQCVSFHHLALASNSATDPEPFWPAPRPRHYVVQVLSFGHELRSQASPPVSGIHLPSRATLF